MTLLRIHNTRPMDDFATTGEARRARFRTAFDAILSQYTQRADAIVARAEARLERRERQRRALAALATAMRSSSETMQRASTSTTYTAPALGCSSDFECRWGNVCVKPPSRMQGVCARAVDAHGIPTFQAPRGSSFRARRTRVHIFQPVPDRLFVHRRTLFEVRTIGARLSPYSLFVEPEKR